VLGRFLFPAPPVPRRRGSCQGRTGLEALVLGWYSFQRRLFHGGAACCQGRTGLEAPVLGSYPFQRRLFHGGAALGSCRSRTGLEAPVLGRFLFPAPPVPRRRGSCQGRTGLEAPVLDCSTAARPICLDTLPGVK